jgi:hypothetical protein
MPKIHGHLHAPRAHILMTHKPLAHPGIGASIPKYVSRNAYFITMRAPGTHLVWNHLKGGAPTLKNAQYAAYLISALYSL